MKHPGPKLLGVGVLLSLAAGPANCATLYKWVDEQGNVTYQDTPPPGNVQYEESVVDPAPTPLPEGTGRQIEEAALGNPVSLYTVPQCDTCDLVRIFLERHSIPFAEKDVRNNLETQAELEQAAGSLTVPTLIVGDRVLDGYSSNAIRSALLDAGFPMDDPGASGDEAGDGDIGAGDEGFGDELEEAAVTPGSDDDESPPENQ